MHGCALVPQRPHLDPCTKLVYLYSSCWDAWHLEVTAALGHLSAICPRFQWLRSCLVLFSYLILLFSFSFEICHPIMELLGRWSRWVMEVVSTGICFLKSIRAWKIFRESVFRSLDSIIGPLSHNKLLEQLSEFTMVLSTDKPKADP